MDIRIINSKGELINVSKLSLKVMGMSLIGIDEAKNVMQIEEYGSEKEAKGVLEGIVFAIWGHHLSRESEAPIIFNLNEEYKKRINDVMRKEEEVSGESEQDKEEHKNTEGVKRRIRKNSKE